MLLHNSAPLADGLPCDKENRKSMGEDTPDAAVRKSFCPCKASAVQFGLFHKQVEAFPAAGAESEFCVSVAQLQQIEEFWSKNVSQVAERPSKGVVFVCVHSKQRAQCV